MSFTRSWMGFLIDTHSKIERGSENCWGWSVDSDPFWYPNLWPERTLRTASLSLVLCWLSVGFSQWKTEARAWTVGGEKIWICLSVSSSFYARSVAASFPNYPFSLNLPLPLYPSTPPSPNIHTVLTGNWLSMIYPLSLQFRLSTAASLWESYHSLSLI